MLEIVIDQNLCCGSARCIEACPEQAISLVNGKAVLNLGKCDSDGVCIAACPNGAIDYEDEYADVGCGF